MKIQGLAGGVTAAIFGCVVMGVTPSAKSITINLTFDSVASDSPSFDPNANLLTPIIQAAANFWEDIIEDAGTLNIEYYYDNLSDPNGTLASHLNLATSGGKPTSARIRVDTQLNGVNRLWFFDPTPTNNSEYNLQQTLYRDLSGANQTNWFNGAPPDLLEVGYRGGTTGGAPADAVNGFDMLSTMIHEIGHAVGLTSNVASGEVADGDYDFNSAFVNGAVMSVDDNGFHIDPTVSLMCSGCGATGVRRMPTATDVFAAASAAGWTQIDLPRQDFLGGVNWGTTGNWEGNQVPGTADWAFLRNGGNITLNVNDTVARLFVGEGTDLFTNANRLDVNGTATVEHDGVAVRPQVFVQAGGELEANRLDLNGGELDMSGGLADINGVLDMNDTNGFQGRITGNGSVDVSSSLNNDGDIIPDGGTLTFTSAAANPWNLDGAGNGAVNASFGDINFNSGGLSDAFDGTMTVGAGRSITFVEGWEHGFGGVLNLNGGTLTADRAKVDGGAMIIRGDINVDKRGELDGVLTIHASVTADMPDADDRLDLGNATTDTITYNGGNFTGNGKLVQDGDATVTAGSTVNISVNTFDFDGDTISDTTIEAGATMNITGTGIADAHNGVITINSGTLNVATGNTIFLLGNPVFLPASWEMAGSLVFLDNGTDPVLSGSKVIITGGVSVPITGTGVIDAPVEFRSTSNTEITSVSDRLRLNGTTTFNGGTFTGFGELEQNGDATVIAATTISVGTYDMDGGGSTTLSLDNDLTVNSTNLDNGNNVFNGTVNINNSSSELAINTASPWTMAGTLNVTTGTTLTFPSISGQDFTLGGTTNIDGGTRFASKVNLTGSVVFATATSTLAVLGGDLVSPNTINGANITGPAGSKLRTTSGNALVGNGTVAVRLDFLAGSELLADNGTLNVQGDFISMGVIGTNDTDGVLNVTTAWNTNSATELQLNGGSVTGAAITNGGLTTGTGTIATTGGFSNENILTATGGAITLNTVGVLDLDGAAEAGTVNVISDVIVNTASLDTGDNVFNGTINVTSFTGELQVNTAAPWTLAGTFNAATGTNFTFPSITGQDFTLSGTANVNGGTRFDARVDLTGNVVLATATSTLAVLGGDLVSPNTLNGGTVTGPAGSKLRTTAGNALVGNGTISVALDFLPGSELFADNGTLSVPGNFISMGVIGTNDIDGILDVTTAWNTNTATELRLNGGSVSGATITNGGLTTGFGTVSTTGGFSNDNILSANGGTLILNPTGALSLDGGAGTGTINALTGSVVVAKNVGIAGFAGTLNVGTGQSFTMNFGGLSNSGMVNLTGGKIVAPSFNQFNTLVVSTTVSALEAASSFENGSVNTLNADLNLLGDSLIRAGAGFSGAGSLNVTAGTTLTALDGAVVGVGIVNDGSVVLGSSPGFLGVADFTQTALGQIEFELQGLTQGVSYDWMKVGDTATLDGLLDVLLLGGYAPSLGDSFDIITAGLGVVGTFNNIMFPAIPNIGLGISYAANTVTLNAGLLGDLNNDGFVGVDDLNIVLVNWNAPVDAGVWTNGDPTGDGFVGVDDLNIVLVNWNAGTPPPAEALALVPEPGMFGLMAVLSSSLIATRRKHG